MKTAVINFSWLTWITFPACCFTLCLGSPIAAAHRSSSFLPSPAIAAHLPRPPKTRTKIARPQETRSKSAQYCLGMGSKWAPNGPKIARYLSSSF